MDKEVKQEPEPAPGQQTAAPKPAAKKAAKPKRKSRPKRARKKAAAETRGRKKRTARPYPAGPLEEALELGDQIQKVAAGQRVRRLTLLKAMNRSPTSSSTNMLITNSGKYGITTGSYVADFLELTPDGKIATALDSSRGEKLKAKFRLGIEGVAPFKVLYDEYQSKRLPEQEVMRDLLLSKLPEIADAKEAIDTFIVNAKYLGLLQTIGGNETLLPIEQIIDELPPEGARLAETVLPLIGGADATAAPSADKIDWDSTCFYIAPIGKDGSDARKHSDLFLHQIVEPALKGFNLTVVRADKIGASGMITTQILEYILRAKLAVVDLSMHNPNVFYELAIRHAAKLPVVLIIRKADHIPFDINQARTIEIDTTDIYSLVPKLQTYQSEIAAQVRSILASSDAITNPLTVYSPGFQVSFPR